MESHEIKEMPSTHRDMTHDWIYSCRVLKHVDHIKGGASAFPNDVRMWHDGTPHRKPPTIVILSTSAAWRGGAAT